MILCTDELFGRAIWPAPPIYLYSSMCNSGDKGAPWSLLLEFRIKLGSGGGLADKTGHSPPPAGGAYATFLRFMARSEGHGRRVGARPHSPGLLAFELLLRAFIGARRICPRP